MSILCKLKDKLIERKYLASIAFFSFLFVAIALISQHIFDMQPCPWCILQRIIFVAIGLISLFLFAVKSNLFKMLGLMILSFLSVLGMWTAIYQYFIASQLDSCGLSFADKFVNSTGLGSFFPNLFEVRGGCADGYALLGVPYELYGLAGFFMLFMIANINIVKLKKITQ